MWWFFHKKWPTNDKIIDLSEDLKLFNKLSEIDDIIAICVENDRIDESDMQQIWDICPSFGIKNVFKLVAAVVQKQSSRIGELESQLKNK